MNDTKIVKILKALDAEELKSFGKFVESPYFNSSSINVKLFKILKKYYPEFKDKDIAIEKIYKKLYPSQKYNDGTIRNAISETGQLAEKFLSIEKYLTIEHRVKLDELNMLREKNISGLKEKLLDSLLEKYGKAKGFMEAYKDVALALLNMKLSDAFNEDSLHKNSEVYTRRTEFAALEALDFMIHSKLEARTNEFRNLTYVDYMVKMYDCFDFEKFLKYVEENSPEIYRVVAIEYYVVKMYLNVDFEKNADKFENFFYADYEKFSKEYLYSLYINYSNSYQVQINEFASLDKIGEYSIKLLKFYDIYIEKKIYKVYFRWIPSGVYMNIARLWAISGDFDNMKKYIDDLKNKIDPTERDKMFNFVMGEYYTGIKNYESAIVTYNKISKPTFQLSLKVKTGMMINHFYLGNYETALSISDAFGKELKENIRVLKVHLLRLKRLNI